MERGAVRWLPLFCIGKQPTVDMILYQQLVVFLLLLYYDEGEGRADRKKAHIPIP